MKMRINSNEIATIIAIGKKIADRGLVTGVWGNISCRISNTNNIAITPLGCDYKKLKRKDICIVTLHGEIISAELTPSSELPLHLAIYNKRPDIAAIIHTHSVFASACAVARKAIPPIIEDLIQINGGEVAVAEYALPGTPALANNVITALNDSNAILLSNHGVVGCGVDLTEALTICELVEKSAHIYICAQNLGGSSVLSAEDCKIMHDFCRQHYRKRNKQ